jgi:hypothetical protein
MKFLDWKENDLISFPFWKKMDTYSLKVNGAQFDDKLTISPMQGKKRRIKMNRTQFYFIPSCDFTTKVDGYKISLPGLEENLNNFSLTLISLFLKDQEKGGRYLLTSHSESPFKINGVLSYSSFIERGDVIDIGYNRLEFQSSDHEKISTGVGGEFYNEDLFNSNLNILIEGETGTGKSRLAKILHEKSGRCGDFVQVNLASYSENLIESELFGHVKGAFTGALEHKQGAFLYANKGTLFLDEIDSLPINLQTKLLLFLDTNEFRQVGGEALKKTDIRLILASGRALKSMVKKGEMRRDFFFRINSGAKITLKPLRENIELLEKICKEFSKKEEVYIHPALFDYYKKLSWPGNIRQLLSHLNKKKVLGKGRKFEFDINDEDLIEHEKEFFKSNDDVRPSLSLEEVKRKYSFNVYKHCGENLEEASSLLKISKNTLRSFIKRIKVLN